MLNSNQILFLFCTYVCHVEFPNNGNDAVAGDIVSSIKLPFSVFANIRNQTEVGLFFVLYRKSTLFPLRDRANATGVVDGRTTIVASSIIAATVGLGLSFKNLEPPVVINLSIATEINGSVNKLYVFSFIIHYKSTLRKL